MVLPSKLYFEYLEMNYPMNKTNHQETIGIYWAPFETSEDIFNDNLEENPMTIPSRLLNGTNSEMCLAFNKSSKNFMTKSCDLETHFFCKVPLDGFIFKAKRNSTAKPKIETDYILLNEENFLYLSGFRYKWKVLPFRTSNSVFGHSRVRINLT